MTAPSAEDVATLARLAGLRIDPAYLPTVAANLETLLRQAALLFDPPVGPLVEPAPVYRP
jgi:hypothetical protein